MKAWVPTLAPPLRPNAQGDLLALLFLNPDDEFSISDVACRLGALLAAVHREAQRLVASDIITDHEPCSPRWWRTCTEPETYVYGS